MKPAKYMRPEVVAEILDEVLPEAERGDPILRTVTKSGCNDYETADYQNVTISRFRTSCNLPNPEITVTLRLCPPSPWEAKVQFEWRAEKQVSNSRAA
jgi:hypothetical protein